MELKEKLNGDDDVEQLTDTSFKGMLEPAENAESPDQEGEEYQFNQRSATIFLLDFRKGMFEKDSDGSYYFKKCIECCKTSMLNLARKQQKNVLTGIVVFGTLKSSGPTVPRNVAELQPLGMVSVERIQQLDNMIINGFEDFKNQYGQEDKFSLALAMHYSQVSIKKWKQKVYKRGIIVFTDDDDPYASDASEAHKARKQAEELSLLGVDLDLVPFGRFDVDKFYKELVLTVKDVSLDEWSQCEASTSIEVIVKEVEDIVSKYQTHYRILSLGEEREILVTVFRVYSEPKRVLEPEHYRGGKTWKKDEQEEDEEGTELPNSQMETQELAGDSLDLKAEMILSKDYYTYNFGERSITMSKADVNWMKVRSGVGYSLVGFAETRNIPEYWTVKNPYFMTAYDKDQGGGELWGYLYSRCLERGLSMVCWYKFHKGSRPSPVALTPVTAKSSRGLPVEGMIVRFLPYLDNLVEVDGLEKEEGGGGWGRVEPGKKQRAAAEALVKKLSFPFDPASFHDHEHRSALAMVEALALGYDEAETFEDDTVTDPEGLDERLGEDVVREFKKCTRDLREEEEEEEMELWERKRKAEGGHGAAEKPRKQPKKQLGLEEIIAVVKRQEAENLTMKDLKDLLKSEGVKSVSNMKKPELISAAYSIFLRE